MPLANFHPAVAAWFAKRFGAPTEPQARAWPEIQAGRHTLIAAPTGSGKTLAAFLAAIDDLVRRALLDGTGSCRTRRRWSTSRRSRRCRTTSRRTWRSRWRGSARELAAMGLPDVEIRTQVRTGDTPASVRTAMVKRPPHILVTTPESLFILLTSEGGRRMLKTVRTVIVDEIHAVADDKRGSHLSLSLERLEALVRVGHLEPRRPLGHPAADRGGRPLPGRHRQRRAGRHSAVRHRRRRARPAARSAGRGATLLAARGGDAAWRSGRRSTTG